jgi:hypothetical protein
MAIGFYFSNHFQIARHSEKFRIVEGLNTKKMHYVTSD